MSDIKPVLEYFDELEESDPEFKEMNRQSAIELASQMHRAGKKLQARVQELEKHRDACIKHRDMTIEKYQARVQELLDDIADLHGYNIFKSKEERIQKLVEIAVVLSSKDWTHESDLAVARLAKLREGEDE